MSEDNIPDNQTPPSSAWLIPWWVYIILGGASYYLLKYVLPSIYLENPQLSELFQATRTLAPILAIVFLLLGAKRLYDIPLAQEEPEPEDDKPDTTN